MAGPTCTVLAPKTLDDTGRADLVGLLREAGWDDTGTLFIEVQPIDGESDTYETTELEQFERGFGWRPQTQITCICMIGRDPRYHRLLARGALQIAEALGGVVDLGGVFPHTLDVGRCVSIEYDTFNDERSKYWVVDSDWLRCWMNRSDFRMIK